MLTRKPAHRQAPEYGTEPAQMKAFVEFHLEAVIESIADQGREPDGWEAMQLQTAIDALGVRSYWLANMHLHLALTPSAQREGEWSSGASPVRCEELLASLEAVSLVPA